MYNRDEFDIEIHGIDCDDDDLLAIISSQDVECEAHEVSYSDVEAILKKCRWYQEINSRVLEKIKSRYDINREISIIKLGSTHPEYIEMQAYIDQCKSNGDVEKISIGLKIS
jgi:hypothetical protein